MDNTNQQNQTPSQPTPQTTTPQAPENQSPPQTLIQKHGRLKVFIVAVIIVAIMEGLAIYFLKTEADLKFFSMLAPTPTLQPSPSTVPPSPTPTIITQPDPTTDPVMTSKWKTYTNDVLGFSFKHPDNAIVSEEKNGQIIFRLRQKNGFMSHFLEITTDSSKFLDPTKLKSCSTIETPGLEPCMLKGEDHGQNADIAKISLGDRESISFYAALGMDAEKHIVQTATNPKLQFSVGIYLADRDPLFNQILSTLKFTE